MALRCQVSSFFLVFYILLSISLVNSHKVCDPKESFALLEFKKAITSYGLSTWNESTDCCSWDGVECDEQRQRRVIGLYLSDSFLDGTLHPNSSLFTLSHLQSLDLSSNIFLTSPLLPQFGMLTNLRALDLSRSSFHGDVPIEISHLSKLVSLDLSKHDDVPWGPFVLRFSNLVMNQLVLNLTHLWDFALDSANLSDIMLTSFMNFSRSLTSLSLFECSLTGNFPDHILTLPNLHSLQLSSNYELNGQLPMFNWSKSLESLFISQTNFSGGIPRSIANVYTGENSTLLNLVSLDLSSNSFIGAIPSWLYELPSLRNLALFNNHFSGFMGEFRSNSLKNLDLCFNNFQGEISESIYKQVNLTLLALCFNNFSGVLNLDKLFRTQSLKTLKISGNNNLSIFSTNVSSPNLSYISMSSSKLEKFPYFLRHQKNLNFLDLSKNQIEVIPKWVSELGALKFLDLSNNFLSSKIMDLFLGLPNLERLFLDFNLFNELPHPMLLPSSMQHFRISNNKLSGEVHPFICQATSLSLLDLSDNNLSGELPSCLFNLTGLESLFLRNNKFFGDISNSMPPSISYYIASNNQFTGEIPPSICLASELVVLSLFNNHLSGTIPPCLTNMPFLEALELNGNNFSGTLQNCFSNTCKLKIIDFNDNQIEGELPRSLLNCMDLQILNLGNNKITGHFPYWLESSSLCVLNLRSNRFYGRINDTKDPYSFINLRIIDLSHNHFSGSLPSNLFQNLRSIQKFEWASEAYFSYIYFKYFDLEKFIPESPSRYDASLMVTLKGSEQKLEKIQRTFKAIDWSSNDFSGEIPKSIGMLLFLKGLNLSHNKLTGEIPTSFGNLTNLEWLDLSSNKLMGNIPSQLTALTFLSVLNLSHNELSGRIPQGKQFATFGNSSYFGNVGLCEFPLPKCDEEKKNESRVEGEEEDDSLTKEIWLRAVFIGYGCGMVFGIFVGFLVFRIGKPIWIVAMVEGRSRKKNRRPTKRNN